MNKIQGKQSPFEGGCIFGGHNGKGMSGEKAAHRPPGGYPDGGELRVMCLIRESFHRIT